MRPLRARASSWRRLQLSQARGFYTGGTVHIIINNQVGFTTSDPRDARSTLYCSDVAKMIEAPILHVNADDPEAVCFVTRFALEYRMKFHKDVVIDLVCYRRHGHNEADEPAATQPLMYQVIRKKPTARQLYADKLVAEGVLTRRGGVCAWWSSTATAWMRASPQARAALGLIGNKYTVDWSEYLGRRLVRAGARPASRWAGCARSARPSPRIPTDWTLHPRVQAIMQARESMVAGDLALDWGCAENLAYASLHRRKAMPCASPARTAAAAPFSIATPCCTIRPPGARYMPLQHLATSQPTLHGHRFGALGRGGDGIRVRLLDHRAALPDHLGRAVRRFLQWRAGDHRPVHQLGRSQVGPPLGLTLFLPHGYEGQGPEHSSARLERFLQLCAEYNMQVCVPSTPAQMFHMLRRQMLRALRKPLIVMTPKSLLRHPLSVSRLEELAAGGFRNVIDEIDDLKPSAVTRVVFCSGKVYFDLLKSRREAKIETWRIVRLEQLYPFPSRRIRGRSSRKYSNAREIVWCQEEPQNQGGWYQIRHRLQCKLGAKHELLYAGRAGAAAPATGIAALHEQQQANLVTRGPARHAAAKRLPDRPMRLPAISN